MRPARLAQEMRENELGAYEKYRGERLETSGVILKLGVQDADQVTAKHWGQQSTVAVKRRHIPYILLTDDTRRDSSVVCYFLPIQTKELSHLRAGDSIRLSGRFADHSGDEHLRFVLTDCDLVE